MKDIGFEEEKLFELQRELYKKTLAIFEIDLKAAGLKEKTIERHIDNADFYLNHFLLRYGIFDMDQGVDMINFFFGDFFITHCMWSTPASIKTTAVSIKKYYKCMVKNGLLTKDKYNELSATIKDMMPFWQEDCERYLRGEGLYDYDLQKFLDEEESENDGMIIPFPIDRIN